MERGTRVEHFAHTTFRIGRSGFHVLIDPILVHPSPNLRDASSPEWLLRGAEGIDAVFVTHAHDDHLHPPTLLGLAPGTPCYAFGEDAVQGLRSLGFSQVTEIHARDVIQLEKGVTATALPAAPSVDGDEQCALLIETPDVIVLDAVDIRDSIETRSSLEPYRGRIDVAFLPTGGALQWQGFWNQMDPVHAADFAVWLKAKRVASCGGALSMHAARSLGSVERYPMGRADWLAIATERLGAETTVWQAPPLHLEYRSHELQTLGPLVQGRLERIERDFQVQALISTFFTGYDSRTPARRLRDDDPDSLVDALRAWRPEREAIAQSVDQIACLLARCDADVNRTASARLMQATLGYMRRAGAHRLAARVTALLPEPAGPVPEIESRFFNAAEAVLRSEEKQWPGNFMADVRTCLAFDRAYVRLAREHSIMKMRGGIAAGPAAANLENHIAELGRTRDHRRVSLTPNHLWVGIDEMAIITGAPSPADVSAFLYYATMDGVRMLPLNEMEALILELCNGRTIAQVGQRLSNWLEEDQEVAASAVFELLAHLTRESIQLVNWSG